MVFTMGFIYRDTKAYQRSYVSTVGNTRKPKRYAKDVSLHYKRRGYSRRTNTSAKMKSLSKKDIPTCKTTSGEMRRERLSRRIPRRRENLFSDVFFSRRKERRKIFFIYFL
uniref:Uncharacterized protein n=1 Tax=Cucumis melo TaxID=3656 RepID=A0A9I9ELW7_CUCME